MAHFHTPHKNKLVFQRCVMSPALSSIFNHFFKTPYDFRRVDKVDFEKKLKPVLDILHSLPSNDCSTKLKSTLESSRQLSAHSFTYPIDSSPEIYVRISTLRSLREHCVGLLDTLPENQEKALREFLIYTEPQAKAYDTHTSDTFAFITTALKPL
jgi:hypothetical protein